METENFWKGVKPFPKQIKGVKTYGYGFFIRNRSRHDHVNKRKYLRIMKKYGFDASETWSLDYSIMEFMSDNFGGFWRIIGSPDNWSDIDLDGIEHDWQTESKTNKDYWKECRVWEKTRYDSFYLHLKDFLDNGSEKDKQKLRDFCIPRLRYLAKKLRGWPSGEDFPTLESWKAEINNMADKFEEKTYSQYFVSYFFHLWD